MTYAVLFPGQGSQHLGMGADVFEAMPDLVVAADDVLDWSLRAVCSDGPESLLTQTEYAQPALFAVSFGLWRAFAEHAPPPRAAAGHSLGEYTALTAAAVFDFPTGLRLVAARGAAMASAADGGHSGMAALLGATVEEAESVAAARRDQGGALWVANINAPGQVVVAGGLGDLEWVQEHGREFGIRRAVPLKVAAGFHSPLMERAAAVFAEELASVSPAAPEFPVVANASAHLVDDVISSLVTQITSPVRFSESLELLGQMGVDTFVHVGPGDVTAGMVRRTLPDARVEVVSSIEDARRVAAAV